MADFRIENSILTDRPFAEPDEAYIYQYIHVRDLLPVDLAAHASVAAAAAAAAFGTDFRPDMRQTDALCRRMLLLNRYPQSVSARIDMLLCASGTVHWRCGEIFVHRGFVMRAVRPEAVTLCYDIPFGEAHTSARLAAHRTAMAEAARRGWRSVVRCNADGMAVTADDSPLFAVFGRRIVTPPALPSVERDRVVRAAARAGYALTEEPLERSRLSSADELFYCDCRGITALASCDGRTYMDIIARRVADGMQI